MTDDKVNHPSHYVDGRMYEPIDVIEDWGLGFHLGNAVKYISRAGRKESAVEDLEKAVWYIRRHIEKKDKFFVKLFHETAEIIRAHYTCPLAHALVSDDWKLTPHLSEALLMVKFGSECCLKLAVEQIESEIAERRKEMDAESQDQEDDS